MDQVRERIRALNDEPRRNPQAPQHIHCGLLVSAQSQRV